MAKDLDCAGCIGAAHLDPALEIGAVSVGGVVPSQVPAAGGLILLDDQAKLPLAVMPGGAAGGIDAATLNGYPASATPAANTIPVLDANGKLPLDAFPGSGSGGGIDAATLGGVPANEYALKSDLPNVSLANGMPSLFDADGDGRVDAALLPLGMFRERIRNGKGHYVRPGDGGARFTARELTFLKRSSDTLLEITSFQAGGGYMTGVHGRAAVLEFDLDGYGVGHGGEHNSNGGGGFRLWPRLVRQYVQGIRAGVHHAKLDQRVDYSSHYYFRWSGNEHFEVRELPVDEKRALRRFNSDIRTTVGAWTGVQDRGITMTKVGGANVPVLVTVQDVWGSNANTENGGPGCQWMLYVDSSPVGRDAAIHHDNDDGWFSYASTFGWIVENLPAGAHSFDIRVFKRPRSSECMNGWSGAGFISVLELDPQRSTYARNFPDQQTDSTDWVAVPGRPAVTYSKKEGAESTELRVSYMDNTGYQFASHNYGCRWRLLMNGQPIAETSEHTANIQGWRLKPILWEVVVPGQATGAYTFQLQARRGDASVCRMGWYTSDASGASNYLLVEELPRLQE